MAGTVSVGAPGGCSTTTDSVDDQLPHVLLHARTR